SLPDPLALGADDHVLARLLGARGHALRHLLDLDEAHPAGAERRHPVMVTEDRNLDADPAGRLPDARPLADGHPPPVDGTTDHRHLLLAHRTAVTHIARGVIRENPPRAPI